MEKGHGSAYTVNLGSTKMYKSLGKCIGVI